MERLTEYRFTGSVTATAHDSWCLRVAARLCRRLVLVHARSLYRRVCCRGRRSRCKRSSIRRWRRSRILEETDRLPTTNSVKSLSRLPKHPNPIPPVVLVSRRPMSTHRRYLPHCRKSWAFARKNSMQGSCLLGCTDSVSVRWHPTPASSHAPHMDSAYVSSLTMQACGCHCMGSAFGLWCPTLVSVHQRLLLHPGCMGLGSARHRRNQEHEVDPWSRPFRGAPVNHQCWGNVSERTRHRKHTTVRLTSFAAACPCR